MTGSVYVGIEMLLGTPHATPGQANVRLLPGFDGVWLGYRDHDVFLGREYDRRVFPGGGIIRPLLLVNRRIVASWTRRASRQCIDVSVDLFEPLDEDALAAAVVDYGRVAGRTAGLLARVS